MGDVSLLGPGLRIGEFSVGGELRPGGIVTAADVGGVGAGDQGEFADARTLFPPDQDQHLFRER